MEAFVSVVESGSFSIAARPHEADAVLLQRNSPMRKRKRFHPITEKLQARHLTSFFRNNADEKARETPIGRLALGVLQQTFGDATGQRTSYVSPEIMEDARRFFFNGSADIWLDCLGLDPQFVRDSLAKLYRWAAEPKAGWLIHYKVACPPEPRNLENSYQEEDETDPKVRAWFENRVKVDERFAKAVEAL